MKTLKTLLLLSAAVTAAPLAAPEAEPAVPAAVAMFYDGLTAAPGKDAAALLQRATAPGWVSCGNNATCDARDAVISRIAGRHAQIPDLRWEIKEAIVAGDRVIVRGEATGTPAGEFLGVPHGGKSFRLMSIDIHTLANGQLARSYHVEDWLGATRQLSAK
jgi:predicted ester cyclase